MESAKNQTLWPNFSEDFVQTNPFEAFEVLQVKEEEKPSGETAPSTDDTPFALEDRVLTLFLADDGVRSAIERQISAQVASRYEKKWSEAQAEIEKRLGESKQVGYRDGYESGQNEGKALSLKAGQEAFKAMEAQLTQEFQNQFFDRVEKLCDEFLKAKEALLHAHAGAWIVAIKNCLFRFQVARSVEIGASLEAWLTSCVSEFAERKKVQIIVSEDEYDRFSKKLAQAPPESRWELSKDCRLHAHEARYECDGGGIFFSTTEEGKRLDALIQQFKETE